MVYQFIRDMAVHLFLNEFLDLMIPEPTKCLPISTIFVCKNSVISCKMPQ